MDLEKAFVDEDGEPLEALQPKLTFNPVMQRVFQCVQHRAINPSDPIPPLDPILDRYFIKITR